MSRQKQLSIVFGVANAQKQGVMGVRLVLTSSTTMFQEESWIARFSARSRYIKKLAMKKNNKYFYPWHSWIARKTPTLEAVGSNPIG